MTETKIQATWNNNPPAPIDSFNDQNDYYDTMIALKKVTSSDVKQVVRKNSWSSGTTYDYYRPDYSINNPPNARELPYILQLTLLSIVILEFIFV